MKKNLLVITTLLSLGSSVFAGEVLKKLTVEEQRVLLTNEVTQAIISTHSKTAEEIKAAKDFALAKGLVDADYNVAVTAYNNVAGDPASTDDQKAVARENLRGNIRDLVGRAIAAPAQPQGIVAKTKAFASQGFNLPTNALGSLLVSHSTLANSAAWITTVVVAASAVAKMCCGTCQEDASNDEADEDNN